MTHPAVHESDEPTVEHKRARAETCNPLPTTPAVAPAGEACSETAEMVLHVHLGSRATQDGRAGDAPAIDGSEQVLTRAIANAESVPLGEMPLASS